MLLHSTLPVFICVYGYTVFLFLCNSPVAPTCAYICMCAYMCVCIIVKKKKSRIYKASLIFNAISGGEILKVVKFLNCSISAAQHRSSTFCNFSERSPQCFIWLKLIQLLPKPVEHEFSTLKMFNKSLKYGI